MKTIVSSLAVATALTFLFASEAFAQLKPEMLEGRWKLIASTPTLENQVADYVDFAGYAPSRGQSMRDEIDAATKAKTPQILVFTKDTMSFLGVEIFGASAELSYQIEGTTLNVNFNKIASKTGGAGAKAGDLVPKTFSTRLSGTTLILKSGPIEGFKKQSITYKFSRFTDVIGEMRAWKGKGGKTFQAKVMDYKNGIAILQNSDGKNIKVPAKGLAPEDKAYLADLIKKSK